MSLPTKNSAKLQAHLLQEDSRVCRLRCCQAGQLAANVRVALALQAAVQSNRHVVQAHVLHRLMSHA